MAKRKTKAERSIEAELQLEAEHLNNTSSTTLKDSNVAEDVTNVENKKVPYTRRLRKL